MHSTTGQQQYFWRQKTGKVISYEIDGQLLNQNRHVKIESVYDRQPHGSKNKDRFL